MHFSELPEMGFSDFLQSARRFLSRVDSNGFGGSSSPSSLPCGPAPIITTRVADADSADSDPATEETEAMEATVSTDGCDEWMPHFAACFHVLHLEARRGMADALLQISRCLRRSVDSLRSAATPTAPPPPHLH